MEPSRPRIRSVHVRHFDASPAQVRAWIAACWSGGEQDCFPRDIIPTWRANAPGVDADALVAGETLLGHGPFRFRFRGWDDTSWRVDVTGGPTGWHGFDLQPEDDGTLVTHTLELEGSSAKGRLRWMAVRPLHDWAVEALFDRMAYALREGHVPARTERPMSLPTAAMFRLARSAFGAAGSTASPSAPASRAEA